MSKFSGLRRLLESIRWTKQKGLIVPSHRADGEQATSVMTYMLYSEIFPGSQDSEQELIGVIREFDLSDLLQALAKINFALPAKYETRDENELQLIRGWFDGDVLSRVSGAWKNGQRLITQQGVLALIKQTIINGVHRGDGLPIADNQERIGLMFLRVNDFLEESYRRRGEGEEASCDQRADDQLRLEMMRNLYFNSSQQYRYLYPRYHQLFSKYLPMVEERRPREFIDLASIYEQAYSIDVRLFLHLAFAVQGRYYGKTYQEVPDFSFGRGFFKNIQQSAGDEVQNLLALLSGDADELKEGLEQDTARLGNIYYSYQALWRRPVFKSKAEAYFPMDLAFLHERATIGIFWDVHDHIRDRIRRERTEEARNRLNSDRNKIMQTWGRAIELYVSDIFDGVYKFRGEGRTAKRVWSEVDDDSPANVDFIIFSPPDTLFFLEVTTQALWHDTLLSADQAKISEQLYQLFFGGETRDSSGKIKQLDADVGRFLSGNLPLDGIRPPEIKKIIPVLVMQQALVQHDIVWPIYRKLMEDNGCSPTLVENLQIIDLEELEMVETVLLRGSDLRTIFTEKMRGRYRHEAMKNFLIYEKKEEFSNERLREHLDLIQKEAGELLFHEQMR